MRTEVKYDVGIDHDALLPWMVYVGAHLSTSVSGLCYGVYRHDSQQRMSGQFHKNEATLDSHVKPFLIATPLRS